MTRPDVLELVLQYVVAPLIPLLFGVALAALGKLTMFLHARERESNVAKIGAVFAEAAKSVVAELDATLKPKLQAALADGVLTAAEKAELKLAAVGALKSKLPVQILAGASGLFGSFLDVWLGGLVERALTERQALQGAIRDTDATPTTWLPLGGSSTRPPSP